VETLIEAAIEDQDERGAETATLTGIGVPEWIATPLLRGVAGANDVPIAGDASYVEPTEEPIGLRLAITEHTRDAMLRWYQVTVGAAALATTDPLDSESLLESTGEPFTDGQNSRNPVASNIRLILTDRQGRTVGDSMFTTSALEGALPAGGLSVPGFDIPEDEAQTDDEDVDGDEEAAIPEHPLGGAATRGRPFDNPAMVFTAGRAWMILPTVIDGEESLDAVEIGAGDQRDALLRAALPAWEISDAIEIDTPTPDFLEQTLTRDLSEAFVDEFTTVLKTLQVANSSRYDHLPLAGAIVLAGSQTGATLKELSRPCDYLELVSSRPLSRARDELVDVDIFADESGEQHSKANIVAQALEEASTAEIALAAEARLYETFPEPEATRIEIEDEEGTEGEDGAEVDSGDDDAEEVETEEGDAQDETEDDEAESEDDEVTAEDPSPSETDSEADGSAAESDD
jgi:hypothetical protein